jgi:hypothetical protein
MGENGDGSHRETTTDRSKHSQLRLSACRRGAMKRENEVEEKQGRGWQLGSA